MWVWSSEILRAIHHVSGRRDRDLSSCWWYWYLMKVVMSWSMYCPLWVNPYVWDSRGVCMMSVGCWYCGMRVRLVWVFRGIAAILSAQWLAWVRE